jgi:DNA-binding response OmpR family regulator
MRTRPEVLIVEDEPDVLLILRLNLEAAGLDTSLAADGVTALRRIERERPDVVVLDLMLPVLDGWSVLAELRNRAHVPPVIVCSAKRAPRDVARARELGAVEFVMKPFDVSVIVGTITDVLVRSGWHPQVEPGPARQPLDLEGLEPA